MRYERLVTAVKNILEQAIEQGGTTLRDFINSSGQPGYFKQELAVYGREGEPCVKCGELIRNKVIGQRSSFYCRNCQR
jgi:formamidopyrimidine-DNA glycosylase